MNKVAVITRTRSRPRMLNRALKSVAAQTMKDFVWVVVNDGGDQAPVESVVASAMDAGLDAVAIHHEKNRGMEAASNSGIRRSKSEYIAIHDDDDTWEPDFLSETVRFLEEQPAFVGVVTHAMRITEKMRQDHIAALKRAPHSPVLQAVHLADMARSNLFPPIAFLYRRSLFRKLRSYDETMAVLGDWDFNLRALLAGDIGVIPRALANYHVRATQENTEHAYANSVSPKLTTHLFADAAYRNKCIRNDIAKGRAGLGFLLAMGRLQARRSFAKTIGSTITGIFRRSDKSPDKRETN